MINVFPASERHSADIGWLRSHPSFSFGSYYDPNRTGFGVMRVCNDDILAPAKGFGAHPHSDMEVVSIVLSGKIRHEDNLGNTVVSGFGDVQRMSTGSGIIHAEFNDSEEDELRLLQMWFMPAVRGVKPSYQATSFHTKQLHNALLPVVSHAGSEHVASIGQDLTIYLSKLEQSQQLSYITQAERKLFLYIIEGQLETNGQLLGAGDTAQIEQVSELTCSAVEPAFFMLIDLPQGGQ